MAHHPPHRDVWSISLGRWGGVQVRLHIFFVLFALFTGYLAWRDGENDDGLMWLASLSVFLLFLSVLIHELGHFFAATRLGGHMDAMVLGPLGGLRPARIPSDPQSELLAVMAGPFATLVLCLVCLVGAALQDPSSASDLLHPLAPGRLFHQSSGGLSVGSVFSLTCWINWWLLVVNLIPAFPFDGGRACSAFLQVIRPKLDTERAVGIVATFARLVAIALFVSAIVFRDAFPDSTVPSWLALLLLAVFVFFSARVEESQADAADEDGNFFGYDFSQGYTSLERSASSAAQRPGPVTRWLNRWRAAQRRRRAAVEAAEDREADEILQRLHQHGMDSLSPRERSLLRRVSVRYRSRERP